MKETNSRKIIFSKKNLDNLPPHDPASPSREAEYSDANPAYSGLRIIVSKTGRKSWLWRYRYQSVKKAMSLGEYPAVKIEDARQRVLDGKNLLSKGINPAAQRDESTRSDLTFRDYSEKHYVPFAKQHKLTWDDDVNYINRMLPAIGDLKLSEIKPLHVSQIHATEKNRTSPTTANHLLKTLKRMLNLAVKWELLEKNPATHQEKFKEAPFRQRFLSKEELPRFLKALDELDDRLAAAAIKLLLFTGCRREEILSLKWENFRKEEGCIYLIKTKNGEARTVHMNEKAMSVLRGLAARKDMEPLTKESDYIFPSREGAARPYIYDIRKSFAKVLKAANISNFRLHDCRHHFASMLASANVPLLTISKLLGHRDASVTQRYAHLASDDLKKATEIVSKALDAAA